MSLKKRFSAEQIVVVLRQIEVLMSQGMAAPVACREASISQQSYYRWRKEYGGLELDQVVRWLATTFGTSRQSVPRCPEWSLLDQQRTKVSTRTEKLGRL